MTRTVSHHADPPSRGQLWLYGGVRGLLLGLGRIWLRLGISGRQHVPAEGPFILAPVHRSNLDFAMVLICTRRRMRYLAKDTLWQHGGFWAKLFSALGGIPVHRGVADREALRTCIDVLEAGEPLVMFPEGTRQFGPKVEEIFDGPAFVQSRTGVPIVPVGIGGSETAMPKGAKVVKMQKVAVVVGAPLTYLDSGGPKARRSAIRDRTAELHDVVQNLFDEAQQRAGTPNPPT